MNRSQLFNLIQRKKSFLCIGLDSDISKIPAKLLNLEDPIFEFNREIIDHTHSYSIAYKPNLAFYESRGHDGWVSLERTLEYLKQFDVFTIADAKRGDIGNTSALYAKSFFEHLDFDAVTVAPYMGSDSIKPFLVYPDKWAIVLALTSNAGASDFQLTESKNSSRKLYEEVLYKSMEWGSFENIMYVVGATKAQLLQSIRKIIPNHFLLVPGVGSQGGSLKEVATFGMNGQCGLIVNSSRGIIYASNDDDYGKVAGQKAKELQLEMESLLKVNKLI